MNTHLATAPNALRLLKLPQSNYWLGTVLPGLLLAGVLTASLPLKAQELPAQRAVAWNLAGPRTPAPDYAISLRINDYGASPDASSPSDLAFAQALAALGSDSGVIVFGAGVYRFEQPLLLRSGLILRGAGSDSSTLLFDLAGAGEQDAIKVYGSTGGEAISLLSDALRDSLCLQVPLSASLSPGDYVRIGLNDSSLVTSPWARGTLSQIARVASVSGTRVCLESPLRRNFPLALEAALTRLDMVSGVGLECLRIERADSTATQTSNIAFVLANRCWVEGLESYRSNFAHVSISRSTQVAVRGSYFSEAFGYGGGGRAYGVVLQAGSGECLVENNIFVRLRHAMLLQSGANGNVLAYNYSREPFWTGTLLPSDAAGDLVLHGNGAWANLWEGNIVRNLVIDDSHGQNGPFNTLFRNRAEGYGLVMALFTPTDSQNLIGNELTGSGFGLGNYLVTGLGHWEYGNATPAGIVPPGTEDLPQASLFLSAAPDYWPETLPWPSLGTPREPGSGSLPALERWNQGQRSTCSAATAPSGFPQPTQPPLTLRVWPNPASTLLHLELPPLPPNTTPRLVLLDPAGRVLLHRAADAAPLPLPDGLGAGLYSLLLLDEQGRLLGSTGFYRDAAR